MELRSLAHSEGGGVVVGRLVGERTDGAFSLSNELGDNLYQGYAGEHQRLVVDDDLGYDFAEEVEVWSFTYSYWSDAQGQPTEPPDTWLPPTTCHRDGHQKNLPDAEQAPASVFFVGRWDDGTLPIRWRADLVGSDTVSGESTSGPDVLLAELAKTENDAGMHGSDAGASAYDAGM